MTHSSFFLRLARRRTFALLLCGSVVFLLGAGLAEARLGNPPLSFKSQVQSLTGISQFVAAPTDAQSELAADQKFGNQTPVRFAVEQKVEITPLTQGTWESVPGGRLWRLRVLSTGATDLNFGFSRYWLPEGATLHLYSESQSYFQGPYTEADNQEHGQFWSPVVPGEAAVIEVFVPSEAKAEPQIILSQINTGYRNWFKAKGPIAAPAEGTCNIDVVCPQGLSWSNEVRSVAVYSINGAFACTGTLVANTSGALKNYFLTANHCRLNTSNAATVVVYWNYQSPTCGTHGPGSLAQNQSGAIFRAAKADVDFALIELSAVPDPSFKVFYSGWDRTGLAPVGCVGIHHPDSDVKAISFCNTTLPTINSCISSGGSNTHWQVTWNSGVTEPGSSGSGIWNPANHRLVGTLSGGGSACATPSLADCYGKFSVAWASGSSAADRLSDWLDPNNSGITSIAGIDPALITSFSAVSSSLVLEGCAPTNGVVDPGESVAVNFTLKDTGALAATNLVATLLAGNGVIAPGPAQNYGDLAGGASITRAFTFTVNGVCGGTITPTLQLQDGARNLGTIAFNLKLGVQVPTVIFFSQNFDGVTAPALPAGWTTSFTGAGSLWVTTTTQRDTLPNAAFAPDPAAVADIRLTSPPIVITNSGAQLTFRHRYIFEDGYDGGVIEIATNGGNFVDVITAGGSFLTNGYNEAIDSASSNPLHGRSVWSSNSGAYITSAVNLPEWAGNSTVQLRWRIGSDSTLGAAGWYVDTVSLTGFANACCRTIVPPVLVNTRLVGANSLAFAYATVVGQTYVVETKTNLITGSWVPVQTNSGTGSTLSYTNSTTTAPVRFFRLRSQ